MTAAARILAHLRNGPATALELAVALDLHRDTVRRLLCALARVGRVVRVGVSLHTRWRLA